MYLESVIIQTFKNIYLLSIKKNINISKNDYQIHF